jgi:hypothetical protein
VCCHKVSGVPRTFIRSYMFARYRHKKAITYLSSFEFIIHTHWFIIDSFIQHVLCFVFMCLYSYRARIFCGYIFMVMYSFVPPYREAKFCGVPSCVFDKLGCSAGENKFSEHCYSGRILCVLRIKEIISFGCSSRIIRL